MFDKLFTRPDGTDGVSAEAFEVTDDKRDQIS